MILTPTALVSTTRNVLMIIGAAMFVLLSGMTMMAAGSTDAAHNAKDVQPELRATVNFTK